MWQLQPENSGNIKEIENINWDNNSYFQEMIQMQIRQYEELNPNYIFDKLVWEWVNDRWVFRILLKHKDLK